MSSTGGRERTVVRLARRIADPERRQWLDAMEAELAHLPAQQRLGWALGMLLAAAKDRSRRAVLPLVLLVGLPCLAAATIGPALEAIKPIFRAVDGPAQLALPITYLLPLAFGVLLGAVHRWRHPRIVGALAFVVHLLGPSLYLSLTMNRSVVLWAGIDLRPLGIYGELAILGTLVLWCLGVALGTRLREGPRDRRPSFS